MPEVKVLNSEASPAEVPEAKVAITGYSRRSSLWRVLAWGGFLVWLVSAYGAQQLAQHDLGYIIGYLFGQALGFWLIGAVVNRLFKSRNPDRGWIVAWTLAAVIGLKAYSKQAHLRDDLRAALSSLGSNAGDSHGPRGDLDTLSLDFILNSYAAAGAQAVAHYNARLMAIDDELLAPETLSTGTGRRTARTAIESMKTAALGLRSSLDSVSKTTGSRLENLEAEHPEYSGLTDGFRTSAPHAQDLIARFVDVEIRVAAAFDSIVSVALNDPPRLGPDGAHLQFSRARSVSAYNHQIEALASLTAEESSAQEALRRAYQSAVDGADSLMATMR
jgi:hypothetical protein